METAIVKVKLVVADQEELKKRFTQQMRDVKKVNNSIGGNFKEVANDITKSFQQGSKSFIGSFARNMNGTAIGVAGIIATTIGIAFKEGAERIRVMEERMGSGGQKAENLNKIRSILGEETTTAEALAIQSILEKGNMQTNALSKVMEDLSKGSGGVINERYKSLNLSPAQIILALADEMKVMTPKERVKVANSLYGERIGDNFIAGTTNSDYRTLQREAQAEIDRTGGEDLYRERDQKFLEVQQRKERMEVISQIRTQQFVTNDRNTYAYLKGIQSELRIIEQRIMSDTYATDKKNQTSMRETGADIKGGIRNMFGGRKEDIIEDMAEDIAFEEANGFWNKIATSLWRGPTAEQTKRAEIIYEKEKKDKIMLGSHDKGGKQ